MGYMGLGTKRPLPEGYRQNDDHALRPDQVLLIDGVFYLEFKLNSSDQLRYLI